MRLATPRPAAGRLAWGHADRAGRPRTTQVAASAPPRPPSPSRPQTAEKTTQGRRRRPPTPPFPPPPRPIPTPATRPPVPALSDPVRISAAASRTHTLTLKDSPLGTLDAYFRLPPVSYDAIDRTLIKPLPGAPPGHFTLAVPRAGILGVWVEPAVDVVVATPKAGDAAPQVTISSTASRLKGSPSVEALRLKDRFSLAFTAELTWAEGDGEGGGASPSYIQASTRVTVWAEPLGAFALLPRAALQSAGDALLAGLSSALLPSFLKRLAADYEGWSSSAAVRAARSARAVAAGMEEEEG